jgi:signal transduction histidine kinase
MQVMTAPNVLLKRVGHFARASVAPVSGARSGPAAWSAAWRAALLPGAVTLLFGVAFALNVIVVPHNQVISSLYAIPVLVGAHRFSPRAIALTGVAAVALYLLNAAIEDRPLIVWPFGVLAMTAVSYLAVLFALQKEKTAQRTREAEEAHHRTQQFLGMVGHDLAGALTGVLGYAELATRQGSAGAAPEAAESHVQVALGGATRRMQRLIDDLRDVSSIGTGHFAIRAAPTDLAKLVYEVVLEQRPSIGGRRLIFDAPAELWGNWDEQRLSQLFTNLISNAINYSPPAGEVRVVVREQAGQAVVSVSDQGDGIPPDQQEFLFQPFRRLGTAKEMKGMGLGLYIAKAIADAHGSRIWLESTPGKGTTFFVALPLDAGAVQGATGAPGEAREPGPGEAGG